MNLNAYAAQRRLTILDELRRGVPPSEGAYSEELLKEARSKGQPQAGTTRYEPHAIVLEFVYPNPSGAPVILPVRLAPPERIVFLPVPEWVIENVWQGEVAGSFQFESDANRMLEAFRARLSPEANPALFETPTPTRRE